MVEGSGSNGEGMKVELTVDDMHVPEAMLCVCVALEDHTFPVLN